jgi:hypothetical protein
MRFLISILLLFSFANVCSAQEQSMLFEKSWGTNDGCILYYADELPNGDYILFGGRKSTIDPPGIGAWQHYVCRMDFRGNILWEKEIGNPYAQDYSGGITKTSWNTYLIVGTTEQGDTLGGFKDIEVFNIDVDGNVLFEKYFTSGIWNDGGSVIETRDSCFVFVCRLGIPSSFNQVPGLIKIDRNGNEIWRNRQDTLGGWPYLIRQTADGGFIVAGGAAGGNNSFYMKYRPDGNMAWVKFPYGLTQQDTLNSINAIRANKDSTFDICWSISYTIVSTGNHVYEQLFKHYDSAGNCLSIIANFQPIGVYSIDVDSNTVWAQSANNLYIMGSDSIFRREVGVEGTDSLYRVIFKYIKTTDGGYLGVGQFIPDFNTDWQFYVVKFGDARYKADEFAESVNAYPNPSLDGNVTLTFDMKTDNNVHVRILTIEGKLVYSTDLFCPANSHTELPLKLDENLTNAGMYLLEASTSETVIRKKLIVLRKH